MSKRGTGPLAWGALLVALWIVLALCTFWEPVVRDGWGNVNWHRLNKLDLESTWGLLKYGWLGSNPRLGQTVTTLMYTPGPYHVVFTPLLELGLFWLMTTLVLGRWPSVRRADDAMVFATVTAITALCTPQFGPMLFYRPFTGNYTFGLVLNLLWLVPYRLHVAEPRTWHWWWAPLLLVLGFAAGLCNEHTGPAFLALGTLAVVWSARRGHGIKPWMLAGLVGLLAGYILLLVAPGHDARYGGLAQQAGIAGRIVDRGLWGNLRIFAMLGLYMLAAVPWIVLGLVARRTSAPAPLTPLAKMALVALGAGGVFTTLVLLASPKVGPRLYLASVALIAMAITGWVVAQIGSKRARIACVALSGVVLLYVGTRCVLTYRAVGPVGAARLHRIHHDPRGTDIVVPRYPVKGGKWFLGEDFDAANLREALAADYMLKSISLER